MSETVVLEPVYYNLTVTADEYTLVLNAPGPQGAPGVSTATVTVGTTTTGNAGTQASVSNTGTNTAAILNFTIPKGDTGATGAQGAQGIPGNAATITAGSTTTLSAGSSATVTNSGTSSAAVFNFGIPQGIQGVQGVKGDTGNTGSPGSAATIAVGSTTTGNAGTSATVTNSGTSSAAVFDFTIPRGADGTNGTNGTAATIAVGTTTTGTPGSSATVTNSGSSSAAVFNFTIPQGATGATGSAGAQGPSGVVAVDAGELTNTGTSTSAVLGLATTAVTPGSYTNTNLTVDSFGRITAATNGTGGGGSGTVTSITASSPLTGGTITTSGSIGLNQSLLTIAESQVTNLTTDLAAKAPLVSPSFTTPSLGVATATSVNGTTIPTSATLLTTASAIPESQVTNLVSDLAGKAALTADQTFTGLQTLIPSAAANRALIIKGAASQSANLQEWQNSAASVLAKVDSAGNLTATSIIKTGGTSTQYLMADGSTTTAAGGGTTTNPLTFGTLGLIATTGTSPWNGSAAATIDIDTTKVPLLTASNTFTGTQTFVPASNVKTLIAKSFSTASTATITGASNSGGTVTYTATNTFVAGQQVTITGVTPTTFNVTNAKIVTATSTYFTIKNVLNTGTYSSGGTATAWSNLQEWQTTAGVTQLAVNQAGYLTTNNTELVMEQTGDGFGTTKLRLQNRAGQNGPLFDTSSSLADLVDFGFKSVTAQGNIRYEARYGGGATGSGANTATSGAEFQIGNTQIGAQSNGVILSFPLIVGTSLSDRRVQVNSTTGKTVPLTVKSKPTNTATVTNATVTTFANKSGTLTLSSNATNYSRINAIASTTGLLPGMILTYVSGAGTFGTGGTGVIVSVDTSTSLTIYTTGTTAAVGGSITFSIQNSVAYSATNTFNTTDSVTITGMNPSTLDVTNATIGAVTASTFTVINTTASGTFVAGTTATVSQSSDLQQWLDGTGTTNLAVRSDGKTKHIASNTATTVGATGTASALPALPVGYLQIDIGGTLYKLPYYNN